MRRTVVPIAVCTLVLAAGCTSSSGGDGDGGGGTAQAATAAPGERLTVVADAEPAAQAGDDDQRRGRPVLAGEREQGGGMLARRFHRRVRPGREQLGLSPPGVERAGREQ